MKKTIFHKNFVTNEEEQYGIDIDNNGNLEDLPRLAFIDEECRNRKLVVDGEELARNISKKNKPDVFHSVKNVIGESVSSISKWNIVNQFSKHYLWLDFFCG